MLKRLAILALVLSGIKMPVRAEELGNGTVILVPGTGFPESQRAYLENFYRDYYPASVLIFDRPSRNLTVPVNIDYSILGAGEYRSSNSGTPGSPQILVKRSPFGPIVQPSWESESLCFEGKVDKCFDSISNHELQHALNDGLFSKGLFSVPKQPPRWLMEGLAESSNTIVRRYLTDKGIRKTLNGSGTASLDTLIQMSDDAVERSSLGAGEFEFVPAFLILTATQKRTLSRQWENYNYLADLNGALYRAASENGLGFESMENLSRAVRSTAQFPIDGLPADEWLFRLPVVRPSEKKLGTFLGVWTAGVSSVGPDINIVAFKRTANGSGFVENDLESGRLKLEITDARQTVVRSLEFDLSQVKGKSPSITFNLNDKDRPTLAGLQPGGYKIRLSGRLNGQDLTATNYFGVADVRLLPSHTGVQNLNEADGIFVITRDTSGNVMDKPVTTSGRLIFNGSGLAYIQPLDTTTLPASVTVNGEVFSVPLPFTRVVVSPKPKQELNNNVVQAVVNGASFGHNPVAPGSIISIFGTDLAKSTMSATQAPLPRNLGGTRVSVNDIDIPLYFVSPTQINAQLPFELNGSSSVQLRVYVDQIGGNNQTVTIAPTAPGVFKANSRPVITKTDWRLVSEANPLAPGEYFITFATGLGQVSPSVKSGEVAPGFEPLPRVIANTTVKIGGVECPVFYSGLVPGFVGLYQINAKVPEGTAPGTQWLELIVGNAERVIETIPVQ